MSTAQLQEIEANIARNKEIIAKGASLERLKANPDFKKIVSEGFLKENAVRLVHLKGDKNMIDPHKQAAIQAEIDAIGHFASYLNGVSRFASLAADSLSADEQTREEIAAEELGA